MPHINMPDLPGITAGFAYAPEVGAAMSQLAEALLRAPSPLSRSFRELLAAFVSKQNSTQFCTGSHRAAALACAADWRETEAVHTVLSGDAHPDPMLEALLMLAWDVTKKRDTTQSIAEARKHGAIDRSIHDTVAIAAAFCMYNRYVDGLAMKPADDYQAIGKMLAENGYMRASGD